MPLAYIENADSICILCMGSVENGIKTIYALNHLTILVLNFVIEHNRCTLVQSLQQLLFASSTTAQPILTPRVLHS